jgi:hypothetical protein
VPVDTKATINDDVLNNIGTIEVVVLRCQDDPKDTPVNPFDFPRLPVLTKPTPVVSNSNSKQDRRAASKKLKAKEPSDDGGSVIGFFGLLDGASDMPTGLDGYYDYDRRASRSYRDGERSRQRESPRRHLSARHRYEEDMMITTSSDEEYERPKPARKAVGWVSPVASFSRRKPSDPPRRPSNIPRSRRGRDEVHPSPWRSAGPSPEREYIRDRLTDRKPSHTGYDTKRRNSSADLLREIAKGQDELARSRHVDARVVRRSGRNRRRSGTEGYIQYVAEDYDERHRGRHRRKSSIEQGRSRSSTLERRRSRSSDRRKRERRENEERNSAARKLAEMVFQDLKESHKKPTARPPVESSVRRLEMSGPRNSANNTPRTNILTRSYQYLEALRMITSPA